MIVNAYYRTDLICIGEYYRQFVPCDYFRSPGGPHEPTCLRSDRHYKIGGEREMHSSPSGGVLKRRAYAGRLTAIFAGISMLTAGPMTSTVRAQTAVDQTNSSGEQSGLTEIIVTARKRAETTQSIPESIDAFNSEEITDAHITKIDDLANLVSNLNITTRADNTPDVVLRGVG